jgi:hypothetical protein
MTRTAHAAALALSLVMSLAIFSSVSQLYTPSHTGAMLAQVQADTPVQRS